MFACVPSFVASHRARGCNKLRSVLKMAPLFMAGHLLSVLFVLCLSSSLTHTVRALLVNDRQTLLNIRSSAEVLSSTALRGSNFNCPPPPFITSICSAGRYRISLGGNATDGEGSGEELQSRRKKKRYKLSHWCTALDIKTYKSFDGARTI